MGDVYRLQIWETVEATARAFPYAVRREREASIAKSNLEHLAWDNHHLKRESMPHYKNIRRGVKALGVTLVDDASRGIFPRKLKQRPHARFRSSQRQHTHFVTISDDSFPKSCRAGEI